MVENLNIVRHTILQKRERDFAIVRLKAFWRKLTNVITSFMMRKEIVRFDMIPRFTLSKKRVQYRLLLNIILGILSAKGGLGI